MNEIKIRSDNKISVGANIKRIRMAKETPSGYDPKYRINTVIPPQRIP